MGALYFVQVLFIVTGIVALLAALKDWDWFFNTQNMQFLINTLGRRRTRIAYGCAGFILIALAIYMFFQVESVSS